MNNKNGFKFNRCSYSNQEGHECTEFRSSRRPPLGMSPLGCRLVCWSMSLGLGAVWFALYNWQWLLVAFVSFLVVRWLATNVCEERITIIHGMGIELKRFHSTGAVKTKFLGDGGINAILLHESITRWGGMGGVLYALAFVVQSDQRLILWGKHVYPGLESLHAVYKEAVRVKGLVEPHLQIRSQSKARSPSRSKSRSRKGKATD